MIGSRGWIGIISDTHGLLRPVAVEALRGAELIVHAGDVGGGGSILRDLEEIAPLTVVRGNVDAAPWARELPRTAAVSWGDELLYVLHDLEELDLDPKVSGFSAVISGHSHRPRIQKHDGVLFINPGSAGPRRLRLPVTLARLRLESYGLQAEIVPLDE